MQLVEKRLLTLIKIACFFLLLGRGLQLTFWDGPLRVFFWNEGLLSPLVEFITPWKWHEYVTHPAVDSFINFLTRALGLFLLGCAFLVPIITQGHKKLAKVYIVASGILTLVFFLMFVGKNFAIGMLIEHALQAGTPLLLYLTIFGKVSPPKWVRLLKILIACTFVGHALFAVGFHPRPGHFIDMILSVFPVQEHTAVGLLNIAGFLDIVTSIMLFIPRLSLVALTFQIFWGFTTAFARIVAHFDTNLGMDTARWLIETIYRFPHGMIPLVLFLYLRSQKNN